MLLERWRAVNDDNIALWRTIGVAGGQGEIRTHGTFAGTAVFKTAALNHSATCPWGDCLPWGLIRRPGQVVNRLDRPSLTTKGSVHKNTLYPSSFFSDGLRQ